MKAVHVDGGLYVLIAVSAAAITTLTSDDAYKYFNPYWLYYLKFFFSITGAGATALKTYRSTAYANSQSPSNGTPGILPPDTKKP